jgi:hypothetical protein
MSQGARQSSSSRSDGATILLKKKYGKARLSSVFTIWILSYHSEGTCDCSLSLYDIFSFQISRRDFVLGGMAVTPYVSNQKDYGNHMFKKP